MTRGGYFKNRDVVGGALPTLAHCDLPGCAQAFVTGNPEADL